MGMGEEEPEPIVVERLVVIGPDASSRLNGMDMEAICAEAAELEVKMEVWWCFVRHIEYAMADWAGVSCLCQLYGLGYLV